MKNEAPGPINISLDDGYHAELILSGATNYDIAIQKPQKMEIEEFKYVNYTIYGARIYPRGFLNNSLANLDIKIFETPQNKSKEQKGDYSKPNVSEKYLKIVSMGFMDIRITTKY